MELHLVSEAIAVVRISKSQFGWSCTRGQTGGHSCGGRKHNYSMSLSIFSFKTRSTRNTRIERNWGDFGEQVGRRWRAFFGRLERIHHLDVNQPWHLWLLHSLFLDEINRDIEDFKNEWNYHPISRRGHDKTPSVRVSSDITTDYASNF